MYQLAKHGVVRLSDSAYIPESDSNADWIEYQAWRNDGNEPKPEFTEQELAETAKRIKTAEERKWRDTELNKVLDRMEQYRNDQPLPVELRTSPSKQRRTISNWHLTESF
ncbi:hypothetical protein B6A42_13065 [Vibrio coralliilyticus]|nr:hypothetical protein B6A42_13065 [Vibrio coralliilyticus]